MSRFFPVIYLFPFEKSSCNRSEISCLVIKLVWNPAYNKGTENCKLFRQLWNNFIILFYYKLLSCSKGLEVLHVCLQECARVCMCTCGLYLYGLFMAVEFFNLQSHTSKKLLHVSVLQVKWNEHSSPFRNRRLETTEDATWIMTELGQKQAELDQSPLWHVGVRKPAGWMGGGGGLGVRVCVHVSPHCPWGAAAREAALPGARARAAQLYGIHATLQTQAWKLWVRKVPVVCFCCIQRNKILSTCFVNKPKTFLTPIINFSS